MINKADGDNVQMQNATLQYKSAYIFLHNANGWQVEVNCCSALEKIGLDKVWGAIETHNSLMKGNGFFAENRNVQKIFWLHHAIKE